MVIVIMTDIFQIVMTCVYIQNQYNCDRTEGCLYDSDNNYCKSSIQMLGITLSTMII